MEFEELEIVIGIVAPLGTNRTDFINTLTKLFEHRGYSVNRIPLTRELFTIKKGIYHESFNYFFKMQLCNHIRKKYSRGFFAFLASLIISQNRNLASGERKSHTIKIYIIDQIKNCVELNLLNHIYGQNYIQISLFSNENERDKELKNKFAEDSDLNIKDFNKKDLIIDPKNKFNDVFKPKFKKEILSLTRNIYRDYRNEVLSDVTHNLMKKDFDEIGVGDKYGQEVSKLFHESHYFFNLDLQKTELDHEIKKFIKIVCGDFREYPTQDEFGMNLAYQVSVRSNFPGDRHIGAAILTTYGEVISVASIRAPAESSNTTLNDQFQIKEGYDRYKDKINTWVKFLEKKNGEKSLKREIREFLRSSLEFHPCTHAEIAAIIDAAKIGVSVRNCILYTTTFPCHLCTKEIINSGISRVIYLEAYPKSKNKDLYPNIIDVNPKNKSSLIPFDFYYGVGPKRYMEAYSLNNKKENPKLPPLVRFQKSEYYKNKERDILIYIQNKIDNNPDSSLNILDDLFKE